MKRLVANSFSIEIVMLVVGAALVLCFAFYLPRYAKLLSRERACQSTGENSKQLLSELLSSTGVSCHDLSPEQSQSLGVSLLAAEKKRFWQTAPLFAVLFTSLAGLGAVVIGPRLVGGDSAMTMDAHVTVSTQIRQVELDANDLTLLAALQRARAVTAPVSGDQDRSGEPWLVAVRRNVGVRSDIIYFPLGMVLRGQPGDMPMMIGDYVNIVALPDTSLGVLNSTEPGLPFKVFGLIESPGNYQTMEISEMLMNVSTVEYGGSFAVDSSGPDVIVLTRSRSPKAPQEHYVIPLLPLFQDTYLLESRIASGDQIEYTKLENLEFLQVPSK